MRNESPHASWRGSLLHAGLALALSAWMVACAHESTPVSSAVGPVADPGDDHQDRCGDVVGAWSETISGLRARLVTSGSRPDRSALRVEMELQNLSEESVELHWSGRPNLGFATFALHDAGGATVPDPDWAFGGNERTGDCLEVVPAGGSVRHVVADNVYTRFSGRRVLRIGVFWAREMPMDGSHFLLGARITGREASDSDTVVVETGSGGVHSLGAEDPRGQVWTQSLDVPAVCVD